MIVDDERLVRQGIKTSIDWAGQGIEIAAEARHGEDALRQLEHCPVDLIVSDIRMPVMSGLDLAREVRRAKPDVEVVLLSGYEDFQFAAEAMRLGVRDYLLKPVTAEKLVATIAGFRDELREKRQAAQAERIRAQLFDEHLHLMKARFLSGLLRGKYGESEAAAQAGALGIRLEGPCYCLFVIEREDEAEEEGGRPPEEAFDAAPDGCLNAVEETLSAFCPGFAAQAGSGRWIGLANVPQGEGAGLVASACEQIGLRLKRDLKLRVSIRTGDPVAGLSELGRSYREIVRAAQPNAALEGGAAEPAQRSAQPPHPPQPHSSGKLIPLTQPVRKPDSSDQKRPGKLVKDVIRFVSGRLDQPIGLSEAAAHVCVTPAYLCKVFKDEMGQPFTKWLNGCRIEEAKRLLEETWLKTYEIAGRVGYHDYKYFSLMFKKYAGCSPREYRNHGRAGEGS